MGLQTSQGHVVGKDQRFYLNVEATPGTFIKATASSGSDIKNPNVLTTSFVPNVAREDRTDAYMATRDVLERITGKSEHSWSLEAYYVPSGTKNVAPDIFPILRAAGMTETVGANDVSLALNSSQALTALSMTRNWEIATVGVFQEALAGCIVDTVKMAFAGGEEPKITASGRAMSYAPTGVGTLDAAMTTPWTTMLLQPNVGQVNVLTTNPNAAGTAGLGARSVVKINDGSAPATDVEITVDSAATDAVPSFTTTSAIADQDDDAVVTPYVPTHTDAGSPIAGTSGTFTWDSFAIRPTAVEFEIANNNTYNDDEAFQPGMTDAIPQLRGITGSMTFRVRQDHVVHILNRKEFAVRALSLTIGGIAQSGTRLVISMPYCEMEYSEVQSPQTEEATINATFRALGSSGNDAITLMHT